MHRLQHHRPYPLYDRAATRRLEQAAARALPPNTLMQRAGEAVARLALALAPHAQRVWIACGAGNNGGDGLEAAWHLLQAGRDVLVTWLGTPDRLPTDARMAWERLRLTRVTWIEAPPPDLQADDLCIDALLGIGLSARADLAPRPTDQRLQACLAALHHGLAPVLMVDLPSGLDADTGQFALDLAPAPLGARPAARHTLSLLTLKPGLFTAQGRDAAGTVWLDDLGTSPPAEPPSAWLAGRPSPLARPHASHKGSFGDVAILGGEGLAQRGMGMTGAALLAASAALHAGAGRVLTALLDAGALEVDPAQPEIMLRRPEALDLPALTVVCGCGGGEAIAAWLPLVLAQAARLVLDADALNAIAASAPLQKQLQTRARAGHPTVLTPHPLEAARLLGSTTTAVQAHRLQAAQQLAQQWSAVVVLKGSGTVVAAPGGAPPSINPTGNARLATAGTGDVLAGLIGAYLAAGLAPATAAQAAVYWHGWIADQWPASQALTAGALARRLPGG